MIRVLLRGLMVVLLLTAVASLWPRTFGGSATHIVVSGTSMEPTLHDGDYVVVRQVEDYVVGDIIAFKSNSGNIIHRIIGGNAVDGFMPRGDNRPNVDPYLPTPASIHGRLAIHVPGVGRFALRLAEVPEPAWAGLLGLAVVGDGARRRRRGRPSVETGAPPVAPAAEAWVPAGPGAVEVPSFDDFVWLWETDTHDPVVTRRPMPSGDHQYVMATEDAVFTHTPASSR